MGASKSILKSTTPLDPTFFHPRFPHISEKIFEQLEKESLKSCREVSKSWMNCIDGKNILWEKVLQEENNAQELFFKACSYGHSKMVKVLIQKSIELNIDMNKKQRNLDKYGKTAIHKACQNGHLEIVEILIQKSTEFGIELNSRDDSGDTAFHYAIQRNYFEIAELFISQSSVLDIDLNAKDNYGRTAFHKACFDGHYKMVKLLIQKSAEFGIELNSTDNIGEKALHYAICNKINILTLSSRKNGVSQKETIFL